MSGRPARRRWRDAFEPAPGLAGRVTPCAPSRRNRTPLVADGGGQRRAGCKIRACKNVRDEVRPFHEPAHGARTALSARIQLQELADKAVRAPAVHGPDARPFSEVEAPHERHGSAGVSPARRQRSQKSCSGSWVQSAKCLLGEFSSRPCPPTSGRSVCRVFGKSSGGNGRVAVEKLVLRATSPQTVF